MARRGLGRGFDSLISAEVIENEFDVTAGADETVSDLKDIKLSDIEPNKDQPRRDFDEEALDLLAGSIKKNGLIQPIIVTKKGTNYQIVAGERRWRAAKLAGLEKIKAIVRTVSGQQKLELALIENLHREDLNPLETATAYLKLKEQFNMTVEKIAEQMNGARSISAISNTLRLLKLPDYAKTALAKKELSEGHARQVLSLNGDEKNQKILFNKITKEDWSVRAAERFVVAIKLEKADGFVERKIIIKNDATATDWTRKLSKKLGGMRVSQHITTAEGAGRVVIKFRSRTELDRIKKRLV